MNTKAMAQETKKRTSIEEMTDEELLELGKMRLSRDDDYAGEELEKFEIEERMRKRKSGTLYALSFIVKPKGCEEERFGFPLTKFYPDEFNYLQSINVFL